MRELHSSRAAAQNDGGFGDFRGLQHRVAVEKSRFGKTGQPDIMTTRTGRDEKSPASELRLFALGGSNAERMRIGKARPATNKIKSAALELLAPVIRELANQPPFAFENLRCVNAGLFRAQTELLRTADRPKPVRRFDQRLAWHAAAQNAQAANLLPAFHHGNPEPQFVRCGRRRISRAPSADHDEVILNLVHGFESRTAKILKDGFA